ncbi:hypothetical protein [Streptomyces turgidiscabies]|uniref:Uncharacterized protein n=1 Tax=Streptomyces turgidiscabies TaxID=85558 RepID=A0ABU0RP94_9ACTN|nr:hypothetical protein [Streptomyces turgidiscabies]MDQ0933820.1 hypothetical protein [Streptomyces turgidiscabies]
MTETETTPPLEQQDTYTAGLEKLLSKQPTHPRGRAALRALIDEKTVLARDNVRRALLVTNERNVPTGCAWDRLAKERFGLNLDEEQRIFLDVILSIASSHHVNLGWLMEIDDRRLAILLRAMTEMAGNDTIAIGTKL